MKNKIDILNELQEISPVIAALEKVNVFTVPEGYFDYLAADILMGIETEHGLSNSVASYQDLPAGYFDTLAGSIMRKIKAQDIDDASTEIRVLSPILYNIQNEKVYEVPAGYFEGLSQSLLSAANPQVKVVHMKSRAAVFFKYAIAAAFTGMMALGVFTFTGSPAENVALPGYVTNGLKVQDVDRELETIADADIVKFLEANGTDVKTAMIAESINENTLPSQEDYLLDEHALDKYLNSIQIDELKK